MLLLRLEVLGGSDIREVAYEMLRFKDRFGIDVVVNFNGIDIDTIGKDNVSYIVNDYYSELDNIKRFRR